MLEGAISELAQKSKTVHGESVHNARKKLKQLRGMLQFMRYGLRKRVYKHANDIFQDAAKPLSGIRDADVMLETLDKLSEHFQDQVKSKSLQKLRRALLKRKKNIRKQFLSAREMQKISAQLREQSNTLKKWTSVPNKFGVLLMGLEGTYSKARGEFNAVLAEKNTDNLHSWRKQVKYLRYQLEILENVRPPIIPLMAKQTRTLSDLLGEDHDLAVLEGLVTNECSDCCNTSEKELLIALMNQRRAELQNEAIAIGRKFFAETEKQWSRRMKNYWKSRESEQSHSSTAA